MGTFDSLSSLSDQQLAQILWNFNAQLNMPEKSDLILALGSHDLRVADRAAELFHQGFAPFILFSGKVGKLTRDVWTKPEAEMFADRAKELGVPAEKILMETASTNTGENIKFSLQLLAQKGIHPHSYLVVQKPHMLQRTLATFRKYLPETKLSLACPNESFEQYPNEFITQNTLISVMVGYIQRLKVYAETGFQVEVDIPAPVWSAYEELRKRGYTSHLIAI